MMLLKLEQSHMQVARSDSDTANRGSLVEAINRPWAFHLVLSQMCENVF